MPDPHDTLSIFSEVSIALVGFSGIVIAVGGRSLGSLTQLERRRLSNLFIFGCGVLLLSLTTITLLHTTIDRHSIWTIASALVFTLCTPWAAFDWRQVTRLSATERAQVSGYVIYPFMAVGALMLLLQLANVVVFHNSWPFFVALIFGISFALQQFILLVGSGIGDS
jgi:hypothetical protein